MTETGGRYVSVFYLINKGIGSEAVYRPGAPSAGSSYCILNGRLAETADVEVEGTLVPYMLTDTDGNEYPIVKIGGCCWTRGSLRARHYTDGGAIATGLDDAAWAADRSGACCLYGFADASSSDPDAVRRRERNGVLYNDYVVKNAAKPAIDGFEIPDQNGWTYLTMTMNDLTEYEEESPTKAHIIGGYTEFDTELAGMLPVSEGIRNADGSYGLKDGISLLWSTSEYYGKPRYVAFSPLPDGTTHLDFLPKGIECENGVGIRLVRDFLFF